MNRVVETFYLLRSTVERVCTHPKNKKLFPILLYNERTQDAKHVFPQDSTGWSRRALLEGMSGLFAKSPLCPPGLQAGHLAH